MPPAKCVHCAQRMRFSNDTFGAILFLAVLNVIVDWAWKGNPMVDYGTELMTIVLFGICIGTTLGRIVTLKSLRLDHEQYHEEP